MSFLHPLFLVALAAVAVPLVLHLARRRTQREQPWSSLRFLRVAPPRLERRRRIEHWLLLVLRGLAVALLAAAFARPFFTRALPAAVATGGARRLVLLDTSASMRRADVFAQALARARAEVAAAGPGDRIAIWAFAGGRAQAVLDFETWAAAAPGARVGLADARLAALVPGWGGTDLGAALVTASEAVLDDRAALATPAREETIVLVSDLQEGARLAALGPADWPAGVRLRLAQVSAGDAFNLGVHPVADAEGEGDGARAARVKVRLSRSGERAGEVRARLAWADGVGTPVEVSVPAGESPVIEAPARTGPGTLVLAGDGHDFDNRVAVAPPAAAVSSILYVGDDEGKGAAGSFYFLTRAFPRTRTRAPEVVALRAGADARAAVTRADLIVLTTAPPAALVAPLREHLARGGVALFAPVDAAGGRGADAIVGAASSWREASGREAVLTAVDLGHPLLSAFADGAAADFTRIRFWKHRVLDVGSWPGARVLARFDDGSPAWITVPIGRGQLFVMTSGFHTGDSQLGLSSKLVPLLWSLLESSTGAIDARHSWFVGETLPIAVARAPAPARVRRPDGDVITLPASAGGYADTDVPGLYEVTQGEATRLFAVNLPPAESAVAPLPIEHLERAGIPLESAMAADRAAAATALAARPGQREAAFFAALEAEQKPWRFVLAAVLLFLLAEALLAARATRAAPAAKEVRP